MLAHGYYKCTATHGTPRGTHGGPWGVVQQIPKGGYNTQGGFDIFRSQISYSCSYGEVMGKGRGQTIGMRGREAGNSLAILVTCVVEDY